MVEIDLPVNLDVNWMLFKHSEHGSRSSDDQDGHKTR